MKNELTILRLIVIVGFAVIATANCSDDDLKPKKHKEEMSDRIFSPDTVSAEVATRALLFQFPVGLRKWGMRISVTSDPTAGYNCVWVLVRGMSNSDKSDNDNWARTTIPIGTWDMDADASKAVEHGLANHRLIRSVSAVVTIDDDSYDSPLDMVLTDGTIQGGVQQYSETEILLVRTTGGVFDGALYNGPTNRGYIHIDY